MTVQSVGETEVNGIRKEEIFETYLSEFNYLFRGIRDFMTKFWVCHGVCMNSGIRTVELLPLLEVAIKIYIQNSVKSPLDKPKVYAYTISKPHSTYEGNHVSLIVSNIVCKYLCFLIQ